MEVELKLRPPYSTSHLRFSAYHRKTHFQENISFDGTNAELSSNLAVLRLRFYDLDSHSILSIKAKPVISDGVSRIEEQEEPIDPAIARQCVAKPWTLLLISSSDIIRRVKEEYNVKDNGLVCLERIRNVRAIYEWNGLKREKFSQLPPRVLSMPTDSTIALYSHSILE